MKKIIIIILLFIVNGCSAPLVFPNEQEPFVEYEFGAYGPGLIYNLYPKVITLYGSGRASISTPLDEELGIDEQAPHTYEFEVGIEDIKSLKNVIEDSNFFSLPADISERDVLDGGYQYLTIHLEDKSHTVGGSNPDNETLSIISEHILKLLPDGVLESFDKEITEYQRGKGFR